MTMWQSTRTSSGSAWKAWLRCGWTRARQMLGVRTVQVWRSLAANTRHGPVVVDETRVRKVNVKFEIVEKLSWIPWAEVSRAAAFRLYSPELLSAQNESPGLKRSGAGIKPERNELLESPASAALWTSESAIQELERSGTPRNPSPSRRRIRVVT